MCDKLNGLVETNENKANLEVKRMMQSAINVLKMRVLLSFLNKEEEDWTVTKIGRTLGLEKYRVSRILSGLEEEGLVDRTNIRKPTLTKQGRQMAERYAERIQISMNHLMCEGVDMNYAKEDAFYWALYNSESSMEIFRKADVRYRVKYEMSDKKEFTGDTLCKRMPNGVYAFPFLIYRTAMENGTNISWANQGFENPCLMTVQDGVGMIQLRVRTVHAKHPKTGLEEAGYMRSMKYFELGEYVCAEQCGTLVSFPVSVLKFINVGSGVGQILHGSVAVKMSSVVGNKIMPEQDALFTILI